MRSQVLLSLVVIALVAFEGISCQETTSSPRKSHRTRGNVPRRNRNKTDLPVPAPNKAVELEDKDKYYEETGSSDDDDYVYEDYDQNRNDTAEIEEDEENKFIESGDSDGIIFDHVDFILLRLKHISKRTSSNITEILALQAREFEVNSHYKTGWDTATEIFNDSKRAIIFNHTSRQSIVRKVPVEYHIAIIAYTLGEPAMYSEFNKDTREICSGTDIETYHWKSYFKLLQLAIETLGSRTERWMDKQRFLYRGASRKFNVQEGQVLAFQHFISTSSALVSAENFAGASLFEFQGYYNGTAMAIWDHSFYQHEKEVLFSPLQIFRVDSIHVGSHYTRYVLVKHDLAPPCDNKEATTQKADDDLRKLENFNNALHDAHSSSSSGDPLRGKNFYLAFLVASLLCLFRVDWR